MAEKEELKDRLKIALTIREKKAADLSNDLKIPKSAVSQYLSGKSQNMDSRRLYSICNYLDVSIPWLLGYDVPMEREVEREIEKKADTITDAVLRMKKDSDFLALVEKLMQLDTGKIKGVDSMLSALLK